MSTIAGTLGFQQIAQYRLSGLSRALFLAAFTTFAVAAPYVCHQFGLAGRVVLPMHFAVLFAALVMGIGGGVLTAIACPVVSFALSGMPPAVSILPMTIELVVYASVAGWLAHRRHTRIITALVAAMIAGRLVSLGIFAAGFGAATSTQALLSSLFLVGLPGIVVQIAVLPAAVSKIGAFLARKDA